MLTCPVPQAAAGVVLLYHHVDNSTPAITSISPAQFDRHLVILEQEGFTVLPLQELVTRAMNPDTPENDKLVAITFDDAYRSIFTHAYPNLRARGWPFTVFVATEFVSSANPLYLTWEELKEMAGNGASIENHTHSHTHLVRQLDNESDSDWETRVLGEVNRAQVTLADHGLNASLFAYPYGEYNLRLLKLIELLGMTGFGQQSGAIGPLSDIRLLPRFPLAGAYVGETAFRDKLYSLAMPVRVPAVEPLVTATFKPPLVLQFQDSSLDLTRLNCYGPGGLMALSETSPEDIIATPLEEVQVGRTRYNCTLPRGNRFYWYSQLWLRKRPDGNWYPEP